jgi:hypothetical protein
MSIHIRVYPQNGLYGSRLGGLGYGSAYGYGGYNGLAVQNRLNQQALQNERRVSSLQLGYERQLWEQRLQMAEMQAQVQYGGAGTTGVVYNPYAQYGTVGVPTGVVNPLIGAGYACPPGYAGYGSPIGGSGQTNVTNQTATGGATQSVANSNSYTSYFMPGFGSANWMGRLLGNIF